MQKTPSVRSGYPRILQDCLRVVAKRLALKENVSAGSSLRVGRHAVISSPHGLTLGDHVSIGPYSIVQVNGYIGHFTMIGMHVQVVGRDDHAIREVGVPMCLSTWVGDRVATDRDRVLIGDDVWIGGRTTVLSGIEIGSGAVIGAGSVVTRSVPPGAVYAGVPARRLGWRFQTAAELSYHLDILEQKRLQVST